MPERRRRSFWDQVGVGADRTRVGLNRGEGIVAGYARLASSRRSPASVSRTPDGSSVAIVSQITPGTDPVPATGSPFAIPAGSWVAVASASGDYDDIWVGFLGIVDGGDFGAYVASRPTSSTLAAGSAVIGAIEGGTTTTPAAMVNGSPGDPVTVTLYLSRA